MRHSTFKVLFLNSSANNNLEIERMNGSETDRERDTEMVQNFALSIERFCFLNDR